MPIVRFEGSDKSIEVGKGSNLRRALLLAGMTPHQGLYRPLNCQGMGLCGTCSVRVVQGEENLSPPTKMEQVNLRRPLAHGYRLSCQTRVYGDCTIALGKPPKAR